MGVQPGGGASRMEGGPEEEQMRSGEETANPPGEGADSG